VPVSRDPQTGKPGRPFLDRLHSVTRIVMDPAAMDRHAMKKNILVTVVVAVVVGCRSIPIELTQTRHYIISAEPIGVHPGPGGLCVAVDPADPTGVWWWGPGRSGCSTRNTMPGPRQENAKGLAGLFHATDAAVVSRDKGATTEAHFRLSMHGEPAFVGVDLIIRGGYMRCVSTGARVSTKQVANVDIPLLAPY
jgi:hypothetical protein